MNDQNPTPPQDMWPDDDPRPVQPIAQTPPPQPQPQQPATPQMPQSPQFSPQPPKKSKAIVWSLAAAFLVLATGVGAYYFLNQASNEDTPEEVQEQPEDNNADPRPNNNEVEWQSRQSISSLRLLDANQPEAFRPQDAKYYKVGTFKEGRYKDSELVLLTLPPIGPSSDYFYRFAKATDGKLTLFARHSTELFEGDGLDRARFTVDNEYTISSLTYPNRIENPQDSDQPLILDNSNRESFFEAGKVKKVFTDPAWGDVFTSRLTPTGLGEPPIQGQFDTQGFYMEAPDGTARFYNIEVPFMGTNKIPNITWSDNQKNNEEFAFGDVGGCGAVNFASVVPNSMLTDLERGGRSANGDDILIAKRTANGSYLRALHQANQPEMRFEDFISRNNLFFWKDFAGRTIKFQNVKLIPAAECGKPVIYLYPEKPTKVSVKVAPQGGFTFTEPEYGTGWDVLANPNGVLKELKSGKTYPYLFWEGRGGIYTSPTKGFVVAQNNVSSLLTDKLKMHGLNEKEIADFKDFWLPRMQGSPYYFVSFYGNIEMNKIAPLTISPKPDTVIRVLMDYTPLQKPIPVQEYSVKTPERKGFTVVEWGGVIK